MLVVNGGSMTANSPGSNQEANSHALDAINGAESVVLDGVSEKTSDDDVTEHGGLQVEVKEDVSREAPQINKGQTGLDSVDVSMDSGFLNEDGKPNPEEPLDPKMTAPGSPAELDENLEIAKKTGEVPDEDKDSPELMFSKTMSVDRPPHKAGIQAPETRDALGKSTDSSIARTDAKVEVMAEKLESAPETHLEKALRYIEQFQEQLSKVIEDKEDLVKEFDGISEREKNEASTALERRKKAQAMMTESEADEITVHNEAREARGKLQPMIDQLEKTEQAIREAIENLRELYSKKQ